MPSRAQIDKGMPALQSAAVETLFSTVSEAPLAQRMRPESFENVCGQTHFLNARFRELIRSDKWSGLVFWGPPGTGKTTLASVIARSTKRIFVSLSAVRAGVKEIREALEKSKADVLCGRAAHILFIDEVHRLSKSQQDVLLPYMEDGTIRFIGATTENPSFELNNAIASRAIIFHFNPLEKDEILQILKRVKTGKYTITTEVYERIADACLGDARRALTLLDHLLLSNSNQTSIGLVDFEELTHAQSLYYDKHSEAHYDTISAFIKSVRGSDPDAAVYYLARMLEGGEDPLFIARRIVILASEDIGNANPAALMIATSAFQAVHAIGMPEARIILSQATTYLACSEKSNRSYLAINEAIDVVKQTGNLEIPMSIRNAPTKLMKEWGYGKGYDYPHAHEEARTEAEYLPEQLKCRKFYRPSDRGSEKKFREFLATSRGNKK